MAGYSASPLPKKLGIEPDGRFALVSPPPGFLDAMALPDSVRLRDSARGRNDVILFFFANAPGRVQRRFGKLANGLDDAGGLWIASPSWCRVWSPI